jgi:integrase
MQDSGAPLDDTLSALFENLYRRHRLAGKSCASVDNFRINLRHFSRFLGRPPRLADLSDDAIVDAMQWLVDQGDSASTANKFRRTLCALWNFVARKGLTSTWPTVTDFPEPERCPVAWSQIQLYSLFRALAAQPGFIDGVPAGRWWVGTHQFWWDTAERLNACLMLRWEDVDLESRWCRVRAESRKGQTRDRVYRLHPNTIATFKSIIEPSRQLVFPWPYNRSMLFYHYRRILKSAGLPHGRESMFHRMRRSALSHFRAAGGDSTRLADHSDPRITRESYEDPTICPETQASDVLFRPDDDPKAA